MTQTINPIFFSQDRKFIKFANQFKPTNSLPYIVVIIPNSLMFASELSPHGTIQKLADFVENHATNLIEVNKFLAGQLPVFIEDENEIQNAYLWVQGKLQPVESDLSPLVKQSSTQWTQLKFVQNFLRNGSPGLGLVILSHLFSSWYLNQVEVLDGRLLNFFTSMNFMGMFLSIISAIACFIVLGIFGILVYKISHTRKQIDARIEKLNLDKTPFAIVHSTGKDLL